MTKDYRNVNDALTNSFPVIGGDELTFDKADAPVAPTHFEWILCSGGMEYWKLTCICGKRLMSPAPSIHPYGKCSKCGRYLLLPGYDSKSKVSHVPARAETIETEASLKEQVTTVTTLKSDDLRTSLSAATMIADRLRPQRLVARETRAASGRISAWPLGGKSRRLLAAFLDLSFSACAASVTLALVGPRALEPFFSPLEMLLMILLLALVFNDIAVHLIYGASLGKNLVVLVVYAENGEPCGPIRALIRACLKWLLIPGWLIGAFDANERALHDLLAGTLILRGRARHKTQESDKL